MGCVLITFVCLVLLRLYGEQVKLELQDSDYFHAIGPKDAGSKVAQGMSAEFTVSFTPQESKVL